MSGKFILGVVGSPGSGKTTYASFLTRSIPDSIYIDTGGSIDLLQEKLLVATPEKVMIIEHTGMDAKKYFNMVVYIETNPEIVMRRSSKDLDCMIRLLHEYPDRQKMLADIIVPNNGDLNAIAIDLIVEYVKNYDLSS